MLKNKWVGTTMDEDKVGTQGDVQSKMDNTFESLEKDFQEVAI